MDNTGNIERTEKQSPEDNFILNPWVNMSTGELEVIYKALVRSRFTRESKDIQAITAELISRTK